MPELAGPARGRIRIGLTLCHPSAASPKLHAGPGGPWLPALTAALLCPWRESLARQQAAGAWSASEGRRVPHCGVVPRRGPGRAQLDRGSPRPHVPPPPRDGPKGSGSHSKRKGLSLAGSQASRCQGRRGRRLRDGKVPRVFPNGWHGPRPPAPQQDAETAAVLTL